jgi:alpha-L-rhamnosidase
MKTYAMLFFALVASLAAPLHAGITVDAMRVNNLDRPLGIDQLPVFSWTLTATERGTLQRACQIVLTADDGTTLWDSGRRTCSRTGMAYEGPALLSCTAYRWKLRVWDDKGRPSPWSAPSAFETALLDSSRWKALWICADASDTVKNRVPVFGRNFAVKKAVRRARAYVSGLGIFDLRLNGQPVTDNVLEPGETDYIRTVFYATYDITDKLVQGTNTMLSFVGGALYCNPANSRYSKFNRVYGPPRFLAQVLIDYADGTSETLVTDTLWHVAPSATAFSSWYGGEDCDGRLSCSCTSTASCSVDSWKHAQLCNVPAGRLMAQFYQPTKVVETWHAVSVSQPAKGTYLVDFGRDFSGQYTFSLHQDSGTTVTLHPTERLTVDSLADQRATGFPCYDSYTFRGDAGAETWGPHFMYHGFRYLLVYGLQSAPQPSMFTVWRIRAAVPLTGSVATSDTLVNAIHRIVRQSMESGLYNTITDCPHREKLGWLEVPQLMFNSFSFDFDMAAWWPKVALDTRDAQRADGYIPNVAPHHVTFTEYWDNDPSWGGSAILVPYRSYLFYGDKSGIRASWPAMNRLMRYYATRSRGGLVDIACLGDWGTYDKRTTVGYTINCTYYALALAMESCARALSLPTDEARYHLLATAIRDSIRARYLHHGIFDAGTQADYALALYYGIVSPAERAATFSRLVTTVRQAGCHLTTGEVALKPLFMTLSDGGCNDLVYRMVTSADMPGYGYFIRQGATSLPEFWDMKESLNHSEMGHFEEWLYSGLGGIRSYTTGFRTFRLQPWFAPGLRWADISTRCGAGRIAVSWKRAAGRIEVSFEVPVNTEAEVVLPVSRNADLKENGKPLRAADGIRNIRRTALTAHITVGSGSYRFTFPDAPAAAQGN